MENNLAFRRDVQRINLWQTAILVLLGLLLNLIGSSLVGALRLPFFLDTTGTIITAALGGYLPGIAVGMATNLIKGLWEPYAVYFASVNVLIAVITAFFVRKGALKSFWRAVLFILVLAVSGSVLDSVLTWFLRGFAGDPASASLAEHLFASGRYTQFTAQTAATFLVNIYDKALSVLIAVVIHAIVPASLKEKLPFTGWRQTPLAESERQRIHHSNTRSLSLRTKLLIIVTGAALCLSVASLLVSGILFHRSTLEEHTKLGQNIAKLAGSAIRADRVTDYIENGEAAEGYLETKDRLELLLKSSPDVEYIYVYRILEDGCHVVFDLDSESLEGSEPGEIIPFDDAFQPLLPALFAGEPIEPIISTGSYGWLLTVYEPVYDESGVCQCYAAADISMNDLVEAERVFYVKAISLFLGFLIFIYALCVWLAQFNLIYPINTMASSANAFAYNDEQARKGSLDSIYSLDIRTGDELENLYNAFSKTTIDMLAYIDHVQEQAETISRMQNGLILVLADMVESRDQCTGDHVRKTAAYVRLILTKMKERGMYPELLTDQYISDVVNSAPLHDIGKIKVTDAILNKPGKLTDEEYAVMKTHTTAGAEIIEQAKTLVSESGYLNEAKNLANFHHERWDGKGYPNGISGEEIPLSARVMAVADVFDALVSRRSYKEPFPFPKATEIISEGAGTQFDPHVVEVFLSALDEVKIIEEAFAEA